MKKYICLRDDDTSYYTSPHELIDGYGEFWGVLPITLATVPFVHVSSVELSKLYIQGRNKYECLREFEEKSTVEYLNEYHKIHPIGDNKAILDLLKPMVKDGLVEIAQHGITHKYSESGPEMLSTKMAKEVIRDGKEYLEKVFEVSIKTFIPPSNTIDVQCAKWVKTLGMNLMTSGPICKNGNYSKFAIDYKTLLGRIVAKIISCPWSQRPINYYFGMNVISSFTFGEGTDANVMHEKVKSRLDKCGFAAIGTHYTCFSNNKCRESFWNLLSLLSNNNDVTFVTASQYFDLLVERYCK